jgi:hypothetical protein
MNHEDGIAATHVSIHLLADTANLKVDVNDRGFV